MVFIQTFSMCNIINESEYNIFYSMKKDWHFGWRKGPVGYISLSMQLVLIYRRRKDESKADLGLIWTQNVKTDHILLSVSRDKLQFLIVLLPIKGQT